MDFIVNPKNKLKFGQSLFRGRCVSKACIFFGKFRTRKEPVENASLRRSAMSIEIGLSKLLHSVGVLCILRPKFCLGVSSGLPAPLKILESLVRIKRRFIPGRFGVFARGFAWAFLRISAYFPPNRTGAECPINF